jgi:hypothetical protein
MEMQGNIFCEQRRIVTKYGFLKMLFFLRHLQLYLKLPVKQKMLAVLLRTAKRSVEQIA